MAESGYAVGIADTNGRPAWGKPESVGERHGRRRCPKQHHHHHSKRPQIQAPEYLVPIGPDGNPCGPAVMLLQPVPVYDAYANDSDDLDTIRLENHRHRNEQLQIDHGDFDEMKAAELDREHVRKRYEAEASERFRIEELERQQAMNGDRTQADGGKRNREWKTWTQAMGVIQDCEDSDEPRSETVQESERVINIHIRQPCKICKEPVIMETQTVHHRFPIDDMSKGVGINVDGPGQMAGADIICGRCEDEINEKKEKKELLRKVVREVIDEKSRVKKEKKDNGGEIVLHSSSSGEFIQTETEKNLALQTHDRETPQKHNKELALRLGETTPKSATHGRPRGRNHRSDHSGYQTKPKFEQYTSESEAELQITPRGHQYTPKSRKIQTHTPISKFDGPRFTNLDEESATSDFGKDENEAPVIHRSSHKKPTRKHGSSHQSPLAASIKENPVGFVKAVLRHLDAEASDGQITHSPTSIVKAKKRQRHGNIVESRSGSESRSNHSDGSEYDVNVSHAVKKPHGGGGKRSPRIDHRRGREKDAAPRSGRGHHRRSSSAGEHPFDYTELAKALQGAAGRHSSPHIAKEGKHDEPGSCEKQKPGFLRGWSFFQKTSF
ncbi:hypothetical protein ABW21_db0203256 [Orbilia brochopaga]|nr:hypothetical protein ABW21_db0203256 [Drechslerella brochopaga]